MPKERWALLGTNGCGKSTLLRAIAAAAQGEKLEEGVMQVSSELRMGMLEQTAVSGSDTSVREEVVSRMARYQAAQKAYDAAVEGCVTGSECELECLEAAQTEYEACGGYEIEARVSRCSGARLRARRVRQQCSSFSGGWQMRIGLARLLLSESELLIMDEPATTSTRRRAAGSASRRKLRRHGARRLARQEFISRAAGSIAEVAGGRLELYKSVKYDKYLEERQGGRRASRPTSTRWSVSGSGCRISSTRWARRSKASQAKDRQAFDKLARQAAATALLVGEQRPALTLAPPPSCGMAPLDAAPTSATRSAARTSSRARSSRYSRGCG